MNTLSGLRHTLDRHAGDVVDPAGVARSTAVRHRIAVVRRRRRAAGTGVLALAVVAGLATVQLRSAPDAGPAAPVVLGRQAPATLTSLGYTYRPTGGSEVFRGRGTLVVPASKTPTLLTWTTSRATTVTLVLPGHEVHHSRLTSFHDFLEVPGGASTRVRVSAGSGAVGVATYALTPAAPAGYTKAGITYRQRVAGAPLLAAAIGDPGETSVVTSMVAPDGQIAIGVMCSTLPHGDVVNVSFGNGGPVSTSGCDSDGSFDPGATTFTRFRAMHPGQRVRVRAWVSRGFHHTAPIPAGAVEGLRLGVGVYGALDLRRIAGALVPVETELGGHTWRLSGDVVGTAGRAVRARASGSDRVATVLWHTHGHTDISVAVGSQTATGASQPGGQGAMPDLWLPAGATMTATVTRGTGALGIAYYERVD
jgi:hypothetical protein